MSSCAFCSNMNHRDMVQHLPEQLENDRLPFLQYTEGHFERLYAYIQRWRELHGKKVSGGESEVSRSRKFLKDQTVGRTKKPKRRQANGK